MQTLLFLESQFLTLFFLSKLRQWLGTSEICSRSRYSNYFSGDWIDETSGVRIQFFLWIIILLKIMILIIFLLILIFRKCKRKLRATHMHITLNIKRVSYRFILNLLFFISFCRKTSGRLFFTAGRTIFNRISFIVLFIFNWFLFVIYESFSCSYPNLWGFMIDRKRLLVISWSGSALLL